MIPIAVEVEGSPVMVVIAPTPVEAAGFCAPRPGPGEVEKQSRVRCTCGMPDGRRFDEVLVVVKKSNRAVTLGPDGIMQREAPVKIMSSVEFAKIQNWRGLNQVEHFMHKLGVAAVQQRAANLDLPAPRVKAKWSETEGENGFSMTLTLTTVPEGADGQGE